MDCITMKTPTIVANLSVKEVYDKIANQFDHTRQRVWGSVKGFLDSLPAGAHVLDLGCGNGKNMYYRTDLVMEGIDISSEQVRICKAKGLDAFEGTITQVDYREETFDYIMCIAAYHHLDNDIDRQKCLTTMWRILKQGGQVLITVWAMEQPTGGKFKFAERDEMVPWLSKDDGNTYMRYYHIYRTGDLEEEIRRLCPRFDITSVGWELGNWYILLRKV
jgi:tRNA (uracil-5-)-methyltransferase TRM9